MNGALEPVTGVALSATSYLINGDAGDLGADDRRQADAFSAWLGASPCDCEDAGFRWTHDATQFDALAGDCQTYTALVETVMVPAC